MCYVKVFDERMAMVMIFVARQYVAVDFGGGRRYLLIPSAEKHVISKTKNLRKLELLLFKMFFHYLLVCLLQLSCRLSSMYIKKDLHACQQIFVMREGCLEPPGCCLCWRSPLPAPCEVTMHASMLLNNSWQNDDGGIMEKREDERLTAPEESDA